MNMIRTLTFRFLTCSSLIAGLFLSACHEKGCIDPMASNYKPEADRDDGSCEYPFATDVKKGEYAENYANIALAMYEDAYFQAEAMRSQIYDFTENPTIPGLEACRDAWVLAHIPYSQAEALGFPESPVLMGSQPLQTRINAWDFNPAHIDYLEDSLSAGIITQTEKYPQITNALLLDLNNTVEGKRITLGYHAIEFLLWGEDDEDPAELTAGDRSFKDFDTSDTNVAFAERRATFLKLASDQLVNDLASLVNAWSPLVNNNYRDQFEGFSARKRTRLAVTGMVLFGQYNLGYDRIRTTLTGPDAEREESRYSDNTTRDIYFNVQGINALFNGRYGRTDSTYIQGTSFFEVIAERDSAAATELRGLLKDVNQASTSIMSPYDYYVGLEQFAGSGPITDLVKALEKFGDRMTEVAAELNMGIEKDLPFND